MLQVVLQDDGHPRKDLCIKPVPRLNVCSSAQLFSLLPQRPSQFANISKAATLGQKKPLGRGWRMADLESNLNFPSPWPTL